MKRKHSSNDSADPITTAAAEWIMRLDRGLSPGEQDAYLQWLAANPRHAEALAGQRKTWETFDRLAGLQSTIEAAPDPDLLMPRRNATTVESERPARWNSQRWWALPAGLAAAAALAVTVWRSSEFGTIAAPVSAAPLAASMARLAPIEERVLEDGSVVRLNRGATVTVEFSADERRIALQHGEAAFDVMTDASRPFVVITRGIAVRAVGTAFNVRLSDQSVDVIVTEGRVIVARGDTPLDHDAPAVRAGQHALVPLEPTGGPPTVSTLPADDLARRLAWQPRVLTFTDLPLAAILNEFNRHNSVMLRIEDPALQTLRLSARFRSDNIRGFLRLLETDFRVRFHRQHDGEIVLRSAR